MADLERQGDVHPVAARGKVGGVEDLAHAVLDRVAVDVEEVCGLAVVLSGAEEGVQGAAEFGGSPAVGVSASVVTASTASASRSWYSASLVVNTGSTGVTAAPGRHAASRTSSSSTRWGSTTATTSPSPRRS